MKYFELDKEEQEIEDALERGEFKSVGNIAAERKRLQKIAHDTLAKNKNVNLRVSQKVLFKLKSKAAALGMPYQTLIASILHQYALK